MHLLFIIASMLCLTIGTSHANPLNLPMNPAKLTDEIKTLAKLTKGIKYLAEAKRMQQNINLPPMPIVPPLPYLNYPFIDPNKLKLSDLMFTPASHMPQKQANVRQKNYIVLKVRRPYMMPPHPGAPLPHPGPPYHPRPLPNVPYHPRPLSNVPYPPRPVPNVPYPPRHQTMPYNYNQRPMEQGYKPPMPPVYNQEKNYVESKNEDVKYDESSKSVEDVSGESGERDKGEEEIDESKAYLTMADDAERPDVDKGLQFYLKDKPMDEVVKDIHENVDGNKEAKVATAYQESSEEEYKEEKGEYSEKMKEEKQAMSKEYKSTEKEDYKESKEESMEKMAEKMYEPESYNTTVKEPSRVPHEATSQTKYEGEKHENEEKEKVSKEVYSKENDSNEYKSAENVKNATEYAKDGAKSTKEYQANSASSEYNLPPQPNQYKEHRDAYPVKQSSEEHGLYPTNYVSSQSREETEKEKPKPMNEKKIEAPKSQKVSEMVNKNVYPQPKPQVNAQYSHSQSYPNDSGEYSNENDENVRNEKSEYPIDMNDEDDSTEIIYGVPKVNQYVDSEEINSSEEKEEAEKYEANAKYPTTYKEKMPYSKSDEGKQAVTQIHQYPPGAYSSSEEYQERQYLPKNKNAKPEMQYSNEYKEVPKANVKENVNYGAGAKNLGMQNYNLEKYKTKPNEYKPEAPIEYSNEQYDEDSAENVYGPKYEQHYGNKKVENYDVKSSEDSEEYNEYYNTKATYPAKENVKYGTEAKHPSAYEIIKSNAHESVSYGKEKYQTESDEYGVYGPKYEHHYGNKAAENYDAKSSEEYEEPKYLPKVEYHQDSSEYSEKYNSNERPYTSVIKKEQYPKSIEAKHHENKIATPIKTHSAEMNEVYSGELNEAASMNYVPERMPESNKYQYSAEQQAYSGEDYMAEHSGENYGRQKESSGYGHPIEFKEKAVYNSEYGPHLPQESYEQYSNVYENSEENAEKASGEVKEKAKGEMKVEHEKASEEKKEPEAPLTMADSTERPEGTEPLEMLLKMSKLSSSEHEDSSEYGAGFKHIDLKEILGKNYREKRYESDSGEAMGAPQGLYGAKMTNYEPFKAYDSNEYVQHQPMQYNAYQVENMKDEDSVEARSDESIEKNASGELYKGQNGNARVEYNEKPAAKSENVKTTHEAHEMNNTKYEAKQNEYKANPIHQYPIGTYSSSEEYQENQYLPNKAEYAKNYETKPNEYKPVAPIQYSNEEASAENVYGPQYEHYGDKKVENYDVKSSEEYQEPQYSPKSAQAVTQDSDEYNEYSNTKPTYPAKESVKYGTEAKSQHYDDKKVETYDVKSSEEYQEPQYLPKGNYGSVEIQYSNENEEKYATNTKPNGAHAIGGNKGYTGYVENNSYEEKAHKVLQSLRDYEAKEKMRESANTNPYHQMGGQKSIEKRINNNPNKVSLDYIEDYSGESSTGPYNPYGPAKKPVIGDGYKQISGQEMRDLLSAIYKNKVASKTYEIRSFGKTDDKNEMFNSLDEVLKGYLKGQGSNDTKALNPLQTKINIDLDNLPENVDSEELRKEIEALYKELANEDAYTVFLKVVQFYLV